MEGHLGQPSFHSISRGLRPLASGYAASLTVHYSVLWRCWLSNWTEFPVRALLLEKTFTRIRDHKIRLCQAGKTYDMVLDMREPSSVTLIALNSTLSNFRPAGMHGLIGGSFPCISPHCLMRVASTPTDSVIYCNNSRVDFKNYSELVVWKQKN